jgi:hypothetical protein
MGPAMPLAPDLWICCTEQLSLDGLLIAIAPLLTWLDG